MVFIAIVFFIGLLTLFYSYIGYGILLWLFRKFHVGKKVSSDDSFQPNVTLVVAAYNEADFIRNKIENTLQLNYPLDKLTIIFITDGTTDKTGEVIKQYPKIIHLHEEIRKGKVAAIQRAMSFVATPVVIFSDANTFLNKESVRKIVRHYADSEVGGVAGEKKILMGMNEAAAGTGEGLYWKYESYLKKLDSDFYTVVGAAGELFSIRTELYEHPGDDTLLDDFVISLTICKRGFRIIYEPEAYAMENPSESIKEEKKRKIRISAGAFQSMLMFKELLNIFKYTKLSFQYISHRVLRWTICPLLLPLLLVLNIVLALNSASIYYHSMLYIQVAFYCLALVGGIFSLKKIHFKPAYVAYYFVFINISLYLGFFRFIQKKQSVLWEKADRKN